MKLSKKFAAAAVSVVLIGAAATAGTLAYFTDSEIAHNVITSGNVDITLNDSTKNDDGTLIDFPTEGITGVMPGADVSKLVSVTNSGVGDAWVRIILTTSIIGEDGSELPTTLADGTPAITINFAEDTKWQDFDGIWYYTEVLEAGETTENLFETVTFAPELDNSYQNCTANVIVSAEAVQSANNPIPDGGTVADIPGWPTDGE